MLDGQALIRISGRLDEIDERDSLTISAAVNQSLVRDYGRRGDRTWRADRFTKIGATQFFANAFEGKEKERSILTDGAADGAAKLLPIEIFERLSVRGVRAQRFQSLKIKEAAVDVVGS